MSRANRPAPPRPRQREDSVDLKATAQLPVAIDLEFEKWAQMSAKLLRRDVAERARMIYDAGLESSWAQRDKHWFDALVEDLRNGQLDRVERYRSICIAELDERAVLEGDAPSPLDRLEPPGLRNKPAPGSETPPFAREIAAKVFASKKAADNRGQRED